MKVMGLKTKKKKKTKLSTNYQCWMFLVHDSHVWCILLIIPQLEIDLDLSRLIKCGTKLAALTLPKHNHNQ
jgi:hypothetical protein